MTQQTQQLATFVLDGLHFGVDVQRVQEVIRHQDLTAVPLAPSVVRGLINLRGQIVTAIDLREKVGLPPREGGEPPMNVVVRTDDSVVSLLVDEIDEVIEVNDADVEATPPTLTGALRDHVKGVYKLPQYLLLILDEMRACATGPHDSPPAATSLNAG